jgi:hypothetical protein
MSEEPLWDVWLLGFTAEADPTAGLVSLFGMTETAAAHIEMTLPRAMKRKLGQSDAMHLLAALERIGGKAELREHRMESARRSVSRPQMDAVGPRPTPPPSAPPSRPHADDTPLGVPSAAPAPADSQIPFGAPAAPELSKTPRNVVFGILGLLLLVAFVAAVASFTGGGAEGFVPEEGTPDADALALLEEEAFDARAFMNNPRADFANERGDAARSFINAAYAAGARRVVVADLNRVGEAMFARAVVVELTVDAEMGSAVRNAYARSLLDQSRWPDDEEDPEGFGRRYFVVRITR